jgi:hypothetical protein
MLFKINQLKGIHSGEITLAFRKWKKAAVVKGTLQQTAIGQVKIIDIKPVSKNEIKNADAIAAGYESVDELMKALNVIKTGNIYKIRVKYHGEDPRIKLRSQTTLTDEYFYSIKEKLAKLDRLSAHGEWTGTVLKTIQKYPQKVSTFIAEKTGFEKAWLKLNIRKLKNIGLTISHEVGYELSPLGKVFLNKMKNEK